MLILFSSLVIRVDFDFPCLFEVPADRVRRSAEADAVEVAVVMGI